MNTTKPKGYPIIDVHWVDSTSFADGPWTHPENFGKANLEYRTVALLVHETSDRITVAHSYGLEPLSERLGGALEIPKRAIVSRTIIKR